MTYSVERNYILKGKKNEQVCRIERKYTSEIRQSTRYLLVAHKHRVPSFLHEFLHQFKVDFTLIEMSSDWRTSIV